LERHGSAGAGGNFSGRVLTQDNLSDYKQVLTEALRTTGRADDALSDRFVEFKPGLMATLASPVNHLLTGRRGVGKSTTLAILERQAQEKGDWVVFVDVETHKSRAYPDVVIEIFLDILKEISPPLYRLDKLGLQRRIGRIKSVLTDLKEAHQEVVQSREATNSQEGQAHVSLDASVERKFVKLTGGGSRRRSSSKTTSQTSLQTRRKEEFLRDLAPAISKSLEEAAAVRSSGSLLVVLDDFYFIEREMQPRVLDHLHGITKRSNVWLKIGSVGARTHTYADGDPPVGMQPPNDVQHLSLDVGLSEFLTAKRFLEDVTDGVLAPTGLRVRDTLTDTARERAVLIAGGAVARDYFDLLILAADSAWEDAQKPGAPAGPFRIGAENVQAAAGHRLDRKQNDLRSDAGRDASRLETRFSDIRDFARDRDTYFFLVRNKDLDSDWGREIAELEDLRFVHRIMTTRPNTGTMRGVDTTVFMVDIPGLVGKRMQKAPIQFWEPRRADELRKAGWVYKPGWSKMQGQQPKQSRKGDKPDDSGTTGGEGKKPQPPSPGQTSLL